MDLSLIAITTLAIVGYIFGSVKVINQGYEGLVERLGRYQRTLKPGLNFVLPLLDTVLVETTREQLLDIKPQSAITKDNVTITVDAILFWKILDVQKAYYEIENLEGALQNLVLTTLRSEIGQMDLRETISSRNKINQALLKELDKATASWGVKVIRVEVQEIALSDTMQKSLETERAAESERRAKISKTEGMVQSIDMLSQALKKDKGNSEPILRYLLAQSYVEANFELGKSESSKILFMNPRNLNEAITDLLKDQNVEGGRASGREQSDSND
jgi:regulator of protease activity HflC (stomatin/prohibitin superfamily)